ncbi:MAG: hypothetical protein EOP60_11090, partial [Sphingomonadales bacterium]
MRSLMLAPMVLLLGSTAAPLPDSGSARLGSWCGGDLAPPDDVKTVLLPGYGPGGFTITTKNPEAQAFFTNGMQLAHAFAHKAAIKAFQEARRLDPECAMCAWGEAWSSGPTINYGVDSDEALKKLADITDTAEKLAEGATVRERNLIGALKLRHRKGGNAAFADAMGKIAAIAPKDDAIAVLTADAQMIAAKDWTAETMARPVELLETVLARSPDYAPAIHFYIHATEGAGYPKRAEPFADKLGIIAPAASHLIHMPSHTYYWIGRYADAATSNLRAVDVDIQNAARLKLTGTDPAWSLSYHGHNVHFGLGGALMSGDAETGLKLARPTIEAIRRGGKVAEFRQFVGGMAYITLARFAPPEEVLTAARPHPDNKVATALWHYARGEALARKGDVKGVLAEAGAIPGKGPPVSFGAAVGQVYRVGELVLRGRAATMQGKHAKAQKLFEQAAAIEESKPLTEFADPPFWWYPVRRDVAAALLAQGDAAGALTAIEASLKHRPLDPTALALRAQIQAKLGNAAAARRDRGEALA